MISLDLPKRTHELLRELAQETGVSEEEVVLDALLDRLEDWYDSKIIAERGSESAPTIPLKQVIRKYGLDLGGSRDAAE